MASAFPAALDSFGTTKGSGDPVPSAEWNDRGDAVNKVEALLGVQPDAPGNLGATRTLNLANSKFQSLVGTLNVDHVLTVTNPRVGSVLYLTFIQDSTNTVATASVTISGDTTLLPVSAGPNGITTYVLIFLTTTTFVAYQLGAV